MEAETNGTVQPETRMTKLADPRWQLLWFLPHLAAVYGIVHFCTPWLAGWTKRALFFLQVPTSSGSFQFLFSHILAFSFVPAFFTGFVNARLKHRVAQFVWIVPTVILAYKFLVFSAPPKSVFQSTFSLAPYRNQFSLAFHQYFGGGFLIREFQDWADFWSIVRTNPDMTRGMAQLSYTAPFYAGVGYSLAAWIGLRTELHRMVAERVKQWEQWKFGQPQ